MIYMITQEQVLEAIKKARENSKKRNFVQSFEIIITTKDLDLKQNSNQFTAFVSLANLNKKRKLCALVGAESVDGVKEAVDLVVTESEFGKYSDKKEAKKLVESYDFFIAQANLMPKIAKTFGRIMGPRKKMPNPSAGTIIAPKTNLSSLKNKFKNMVQIVLRTQPLVQAFIGDESLTDEQVATNFNYVYNTIKEHLANGESNIKSTYIKLTMGGSIKIN